jgi:phosphoglycolate phosphatase-like HAD superfamily hydrolase
MNSGALSRPWDTFDVYLFDIDGTLVHCADAVHYFAFCSVLTSVAGRPLNLDGVVTHGNTDIGILRDAFGLAGVPERLWRFQLPKIRESMCGFVSAKKQELCVNLLPQVRAVLEHLTSRGAKLGVATGNLEEIGRRKLEAAQILDMFQFGGWSDAFENRSDVFRAAGELARFHAGSSAAILVVGDTPADVQGARKNGFEVIAVASGIYKFEELQGERPELCIRSFEELLPPA